MVGSDQDVAALTSQVDLLATSSSSTSLDDDTMPETKAVGKMETSSSTANLDTTSELVVEADRNLQSESSAVTKTQTEAQIETKSETKRKTETAGDADAEAIGPNMEVSNGSMPQPPLHNTSRTTSEKSEEWEKESSSSPPEPELSSSSPKYLVRILIPSPCCGMIIGRAGVNIKAIAERSGTKIQLAQKEEMASVATKEVRNRNIKSV